MGPRPYLCFCARKTATLEPDIQFCVGDEDLSFFTCKTSCLASESLVSMSASLHLWFFMQNSDFWTRNTSLYGSQLSSGVFGCKTASFGPTTGLYGSQISPVVLCIQNSDLRTKIACVYGSHTSPVNFRMQNNVPSTRITSLYGFQPLCVVFWCKTATFGPE